ncbi:MAG: VWA domain-containing protein [Pirellulales bacterium]
MIRFGAPQWFLLIPALVAVGWYWHDLRLWKPLRIACLVMAVIIMTDPQIRSHGDGLDLWVLIDQSDSAREYAQPRLDEWQSILEKSKGVDDRIFYVDFADEAITRGALVSSGPTATEYTGNRSSTRLASAINYTLSQVSHNRSARLLALTDGLSTEPLTNVSEKLIAKQIPLDIRLPPNRKDNDVFIASFTVPERTQSREGLVAEIIIRGTTDTSIPLEIQRDGNSIGRRTLTMIDGVARMRFTDRLVTPGSHQYSIQILPENDSILGNNQAERWVEVQGGPRVVLITAYDNDPLAKVLTTQGFEVQVIQDLSSTHIGILSGAEAVILNNVPAYELDTDFVKSLDFFVSGQGGGLLMVGGKTSFAAGGWFGSSVDHLLPVSMELKQEHRKLSVAMAIVIDRSGSMAATAPGTSQSKMALADEGAARAIELLGENDLVVLIPVDSVAHPMSDSLVQVGPNRDELVRAARSISSGGGGIFCYTGLKTAWNQLNKTTVGQRHIILFADAKDAEEPGEYKALLKEMAAGKCSVSVIGLGSESDSDSDFLKDIALRGGGRSFFSGSAQELPALFEMETATLARSAFIEERTQTGGTPSWTEITNEPLDWLSEVDGYNLCYLKPAASQAAITQDEYAAPLVAFWQRGIGRVAAVTFPLGGEFSQRARSWTGYGGFCQSLTRWLMGPAVPSGTALRTGVAGSHITADLFYDNTNQSLSQQILSNPPELTIVRGTKPLPEPIVWERLAPGHFSASFDASDTPYIRGAIRLGDNAIPMGPLNVSVNPEWTFNRRRISELLATSIRSSGEHRLDLSHVWSAPRQEGFYSIHRWLLSFFIITMLIEAVQTQTGWPR